MAAAEVNKAKLDPWMTPARQTFKLDVVGDYRRILDRKDVDAVLIAHAGSLALPADGRRDCRRQGRLRREAGVEHASPRINAMLDAYKKGKQVVQVGTQQRSWDHFIEAKKILDSGVLGNVTHVIIVQPGSYARAKEAEAPVPAGLDWDMWQGPAPKKPFKPSRLGFRAWYDYGGGLVADWGAHHVDVAHWFMNADRKVPLRTTANGAFLAVPDADPEQVPDTFSISWHYDNFLMTFANGEVYTRRRRTRSRTGACSSSAIAARCRSTVRATRCVRSVPRTIRKQGPPPPPTAGGVTLGAGGTAIAPAPVRRRPGRARRRRPRRRGGGGSEPAAGRSRSSTSTREGGVEEDYPLDAHTRNFLDCIKSRQKPNADIEIGYYAALPCLLALESLQKGKPLGWDARCEQGAVALQQSASRAL